MKMHACLLACLGAAQLLGCATPAELRARKPAMELNSTKSAKSVAACIADRCENSSALGNTIPISMRPTQNGYTVSWRHEGVGHTGLLLDVDDTPGGSTTRYFKNMIAAEGVFDNAVRQCQ